MKKVNGFETWLNIDKDLVIEHKRAMVVCGRRTLTRTVFEKGGEFYCKLDGQMERVYRRTNMISGVYREYYKF